MKNFKTLGMALIAGILCLNFSSCNKDEEIIPSQEKYITVNLGVTGEYLELSETPLDTRSNAAGEDWINIKVYTVSNGTQDDIAYAYGNFHSMDDVTIKLLQGEKYKFVVSIIPDYCGCATEPMCALGSGTTFNYSSQFNSFEPRGGRQGDAYYGELDNYTPIDNGVVEIATKRIVYGAHYIAEGLTEGSLDIEVSSSANAWGSLYKVELTPAQIENDDIYTFFNMRDAWFGRYKTVDALVDYYMEKRLAIRWSKADGSVIPLGDYEVTFRRNVRTTIRIKVEEPGVQNGIVITREEAPMVADENEYVIEGGKVTEVPIRQN